MILDGLGNGREAMDDISTAIVVPFRLSNIVSVSNELTMEITGLKFIADTAKLLSNSGTKTNPTYESNSCGYNNNSKNKNGGMSKMVDENKGSCNSVSPESEEEDVVSLGCDPSEFSALESNNSVTNSDTRTVNRETIAESKELNVELPSLQDSVAGDLQRINGNHPDDVQQEEKKICRTGSQKLVLRSDNVSRCWWGFTSICGKRPEMEDAAAVVPGVLQIRTQMLMDDVLFNKTNQIPSHVTAHFFGVYDGHGGSQVCYILFFLVQ